MTKSEGGIPHLSERLVNVGVEGDDGWDDLEDGGGGARAWQWPKRTRVEPQT